MTTETVLAIGMARSGTSFLGELFRRNPAVRYLYEPFRALPLARAEFARLAPDDRLPESERWVSEVVEGRLEGLAIGDPEVRTWLAQHGHVEEPGRTRTAIKEIKLNLHLAWIDRVLGGQFRCVAIVRDPRAVVASFTCAPANGTNGESRRLFEHWGWDRSPASVRFDAEFAGYEALLRSDDPVEFVAAAWVVMVGHAVRDGSALPAGRFRRVAYEDLARDPHRESERIYDWLGWSLPVEVRRWIDRNTTGGNRTARFSTARDSRSMVDAWRQQLDSATVGRVEAICGPMMREFGYR